MSAITTTLAPEDLSLWDLVLHIDSTGKEDPCLVVGLYASVMLGQVGVSFWSLTYQCLIEDFPADQFHPILIQDCHKYAFQTIDAVTEYEGEDDCFSQHDSLDEIYGGSQLFGYTIGSISFAEEEGKMKILFDDAEPHEMKYVHQAQQLSRALYQQKGSTISLRKFSDPEHDAHMKTIVDLFGPFMGGNERDN